jgi:hypothetical protein
VGVYSALSLADERRVHLCGVQGRGSARSGPPWYPDAEEPGFVREAGLLLFNSGRFVSDSISSGFPRSDGSNRLRSLTVKNRH